MKTETTMNRLHLAAWAGMVGSALFVAVFTLEGWLRPGYEARRMFISELALGPRGWIQIANFVIFGALFFLFARGDAAARQATNSDTLTVSSELSRQEQGDKDKRYCSWFNKMCFYVIFLNHIGTMRCEAPMN